MQRVTLHYKSTMPRVLPQLSLRAFPLRELFTGVPHPSVIPRVPVQECLTRMLHKSVLPRVSPPELRAKISLQKDRSKCVLHMCLDSASCAASCWNFARLCHGVPQCIRNLQTRFHVFSPLSFIQFHLKIWLLSVVLCPPSPSSLRWSNSILLEPTESSSSLGSTSKPSDGLSLTSQLVTIKDHEKQKKTSCIEVSNAHMRPCSEF